MTTQLFIAFLSGITTFFASCFLPLVPTYIAYLTSFSQDKSSVARVKASLYFVCGFISIFIVFGFGASALGHALAVNSLLFKKVGGVFLVVLGLIMLQVISTPQYMFKLGDKFRFLGKLKALVVGLVFGLAWTPCIGPVLAVILLWASQAQTVVQGTALLAAYGLGIGLPFVFITIVFDAVVAELPKLAKISKVVNILAGTIMIISGILLFFDRLGFLTWWISS